MSVLVFAENLQGKFKKSAFEIVSFGAAIAREQQLPLAVISIGQVADDELAKLAAYGAAKILKVEGDAFQSMNVQPFASAIAQAAQAEQAKVVVLSASFSGKSIAPRVAIKLGAGLAENVIDLPQMTNGFVVKKNAYSGKAYSFVELISDVKVISMLPNSYKVVEQAGAGAVSSFSPQLTPVHRCRYFRCYSALGRCKRL